MSLSSTLTEAIDNIIQNFIIEVSSKYSLDKNEIKKLWNDGSHKLPKQVTEKQVSLHSKEIRTDDKKQPDSSDLLKYNKIRTIKI